LLLLLSSFVTLQTLDDGAELLHGVGGVDLTADTHDIHQATTDTTDRLTDNPFLRLSASPYSINNVILKLVDKQYFVFLRHLILGDAMTKLGKRVLPRYRNFIVAAWQQPMFRYQPNLKEMLRLKDKSFRLEDKQP